MPERLSPTWRMVLSTHALDGALVALGMLLVVVASYLLFGHTAAINAAVGALISLLPDRAAPRRGKLTHLLAAPLLGVPLFLAVQLLRPYPVELGLLLVPATFLAFLSTAWGSRGMPVAASLMFAMLLAMAPKPASSVEEALLRTAFCAMGAALYVVYGTLANTLCNGRYRRQAMAELLLSTAALLRLHALRVTPGRSTHARGFEPGTLGQLLQRQAALADQMQAARDLVLEAPRTVERQRLAGMLMVALEMRDRLIAGELDLERVGTAEDATLHALASMLHDMASDVERVADALLLGRQPPPARNHEPALDALRESAQALAQVADAQDSTGARLHAALVRSVSTRIGDQDAAVRELAAIARGDQEPDLSAVRSGWRLFVSPAYWSLGPLRQLWHPRQPALRHAIRAALALGTGYAIATLLPWGSRDYWVLLTIVVVLRGSLAQTLERRDQRVLGTLLGSLLAAGLMMLELPMAVLLLVIVIAQGMAHAFVLRRYVVTSVAGSVLGLVIASLLYAEMTPTFAFVERVGDTLLGAGLAWLFSYVLPSWERGQIATLVARMCRAMARHTRHSLALAQVDDVTGQPELAWRLARREAYDALSALVQATRRALVEPRAVQPPLEHLEQLQVHGYQLLGQLSAVQSMLLLRRERLHLDSVADTLAGTARHIEQTLDLGQPCAEAASPAHLADRAERPLRAMPEDLPDPFIMDSTPWLRRRLDLATGLAHAVRNDADSVLEALAQAAPPTPTQPAEAMLQE